MPDAERLTAARTALQAGQRQVATRLLVQLVRADAESDEAWHLLGQAVDDPHRQAECEARARALLVRSIAAAPSVEQALAELRKRHLPLAAMLGLLAAFVQQYPQHPFTLALQPYLDDLCRIPHDVPPSEVPALLETFLQEHPDSPLAPALQAYRNQLWRMAGLSLGQPEAGSPAYSVLPPVLVGEYLIGQGLVTQEQVDHALVEQQRLCQEGVELRLGTLLLLEGRLQPWQLAAALSALLRPGTAHFGAYLVARGLLTAEEVSRALANQAVITADLEREYGEALAAYRRQRGQPHRALRGRLMLPVKPQRKPVPKLGELLVSMGLMRSEHVAALLWEWQHEQTSSASWEEWQ